ncbi:MAG: Hsp20/alpha crystallin family protein [Salibacteraceae bacterium]
MTLIKTSFPTWSHFWDFFEDDFWPDRPEEVQETPAVNLTASPNRFVIELAVPGIEEKEIELRVHQNMLTVATPNIHRCQGKRKACFQKGFTPQPFVLRFQLRQNINPEKVVAEYENGLLRLTFKSDPVLGTSLTI